MAELEITILSGVFLIFLGMVLIIFKLSIRKGKESKNKVRPYTGGERIPQEDMQVPSESMGWGIKKALKPFYTYLGDKHTGKLSDYLAWILLAFVIIVLVLLGGFLW